MIRLFSLLFFVSLLVGCHSKNETNTNNKPTVYIIGDSTVKNGRGDGAGGLWGWGDPIVQFFDTSKIKIENHALGGTSSWTFRTKGLWDEVMRKIQPGDYVLMQFGHNDAGPVNDTIRARGTIHGIGEEIEVIDNLLTGEHETVHTYGWYLRRYIIEAKEKGAIPVVMSPIPRNDWVEGMVSRNDSTYGRWSREVADFEETKFINLNDKMALAMEELGEDNVTDAYFFKRDHTHTSAKGAILAATIITDELRKSEDCELKNYLLENPVIHFPVKKNVFIIGDSTVANGNGTIVGWGRELTAFFDSLRVNIYNKAQGGQSSRSYIYEGLWDEVLSQMNFGDYLLIQFGHNDDGNIDDPKYLASLPGIGKEKTKITRTDGTKEEVHTYGWYLQKYILEAKAKGVIVIVISQIPRNEWNGGEIERVNESYGKWAKEVAELEGVFFIDLNEAIALEYDAMGQHIVNEFFTNDGIHTNLTGARLNALTLANQIKNMDDCPLCGYVELTKQ